ncbi:MAG: hypothetical protein ABI411_20810 [Tahibacter sp.]
MSRSELVNFTPFQSSLQRVNSTITGNGSKDTGDYYSLQLIA